MMLVICVLLLQVALATAQLLDLNLGVGGLDAASTPAADDAGASETTALGTPGGLLDPLLDPIIGPTGLLGGEDGVPPPPASGETQAPPATSSRGPVPDPLVLISEEPAVETTVPEVQIPDPTPVTEPAPPPPATAAPSPEQPPPVVQPPPSPPPPPPPPVVTAPIPNEPPLATPQVVEVPAPEQPSPVEQPAPPPPPPVVVATEPPIAEASLAPPPLADGGSITAPPSVVSVSVASSPLPEQAQDQATASPSPIISLTTVGGSIVMSVFVPPAPTAANAAIQAGGTAVPNANPVAVQNPNPALGGSENTSPFTQPVSSGDDDTSITDPSDNLDTSSNPGSSATPAAVASDADQDLPMGTKIGIGVGVGAGSIAVLACITWLLWRRRMRGRQPWRSSRLADAEEPPPAMSVVGGLQERQKMEFESEHDVEFDLGGVLRGASLRSREAAAARKRGSGGSGSSGSGSVTVAGSEGGHWNGNGEGDGSWKGKAGGGYYGFEKGAVVDRDSDGTRGRKEVEGSNPMPAELAGDDRLPAFASPSQTPGLAM
jgi:hypothetical protein